MKLFFIVCCLLSLQTFAMELDEFDAERIHRICLATARLMPDQYEKFSKQVSCLLAACSSGKSKSTQIASPRNRRELFTDIESRALLHTDSITNSLLEKQFKDLAKTTELAKEKKDIPKNSAAKKND